MAIDRSQLGSRRQWILLGGLVVVLAALLIARQGSDGAPADARRAASNTQRTERSAAIPEPEALEVRLEALEGRRAEPEEAGRNPFRFEARRPPRGGAAPMPPPPSEPSLPPVSSGPPPPPPIPLKFIGIVESPGAGRLAAFSDGQRVFQGREGDIIEGRYRIVRIGVESLVLEFVDTGRQQTIRLSGS
jgi:hypothetical protein